MPLVLVENEVTVGGLYDHWQDVTGERYQFPNQYRNRVSAGRRFVYYRGSRRTNGKRGNPEYFGHGVIGDIQRDESAASPVKAAAQKWICAIDAYVPFARPVLAKQGGRFLEDIPRNHWGVGVRDVDESVFREILQHAGLADNSDALAEAIALQLPNIEAVQPVASQAPLLVATQRRSTYQNEVIGSSRSRRSVHSTVLGKRGEEVVLKHLRETLTSEEAETIRWVSDLGETPGWDIEYRSRKRLIRVEVKASGGPILPNVEMTAREWASAVAHGSDYVIALVAAVKGARPVIDFVVNPASLVKSGEMCAEPSVWKIFRTPL